MSSFKWLALFIWAMVIPVTGVLAQSSPGFLPNTPLAASTLNVFGISKVDTTNGAATGLTVSNGNISGTPIAGSTGAFTTLSASGNGTISGTLGVTGALTANGGAFSVSTSPNGTIALGSTSIARTPFIDFLSTGSATVGYRVISTGANNLTFSAGAGTNVVSFGSTGANFIGLSVNPGPSVLSGATNPYFQSNLSVSGTHSGNGALAQISVSSDTVNAGTTFNLPAFQVIHNIGGPGMAGARAGQFVELQQTAAIATQSIDPQFVALMSFYDSSFNAGGTGLTAGFSRGAAYAFYPQVWLHPGATNFTAASIGEGDINVSATQQNMTVSGTIGSGTVTLTLTASEISGGFQTVTYAIGSGNTATHIVNGLMAAINNNTALTSVGVAGMQDITTSSVLNLVWPTPWTDMVITVSTTGTETEALGSVVTGASTKGKIGFSVVRGQADGMGGGEGGDVAFAFGSLGHAPMSGQWREGISYGVNGGFPVSPLGTMITAHQQTVMNAGTTQGPFTAPKAKYGINWSLVNFSQASGASLLMPGFQVDGTGILSLKNASMTTDANGLTIAITGVIGSGNPAVVSGGGGGSGVLQNNYFVGDIVTDANGGQYLVASVNNSTGAVTGLTTLVQPSAASSLGTAIATTGGSGTGLTITPTGAANNTVTIAPKLKLTGLPTACSGQPTNSVAAVSGVLTLCP